MLCGFDDGSISAWRLHDRQPLCLFTTAPAPVVSLAISACDGCLLVGTSRADLLIYPAMWHGEHDDDESPRAPEALGVRVQSRGVLMAPA
jgi:hypothetical protein